MHAHPRRGMRALITPLNALNFLQIRAAPPAAAASRPHPTSMADPEHSFSKQVIPRWSWPGEPAPSNFSFHVARSRGLKFMKTDSRGEGFVKDVFRLLGSGYATEHEPATMVDIGANTGYYAMLATARASA